MTGIDDKDRQRIQSAQDAMQTALDRLRSVEPVLLDLSIREPVTGSPLGHTLDDKTTLFRITEDLGFQERVVGTLSAPETVDDRFMKGLHASGEDLEGCFTFVMPGRDAPDGFAPDASMIKQAEFGTPNVIFHTEISPHRRRRNGQSQEQVLGALRQSVTWVRERPPTDRTVKVYINLSDLMDCFQEEPEFSCRTVKTIAGIGVEGLMFEDPRGTFFPFQHAALVRWLRSYLKPPIRILVHPHAGNGLEHASVIEAVLAGADGAWLGFTTHAATIGHASGLAYLTNLMRAGNARVEEKFSATRFVPSARTMAQIHTGTRLNPTEPVAGDWAYRDVLANFSQTKGFFGDIAPERVGAEARWRIVPAIASPAAIAARLRECGVKDDAVEEDTVVVRMAEAMRQALLDGGKTDFDDNKELVKLYRICL